MTQLVTAPTATQLSPAFQEMMGRIISDPTFRKAMAANPELALKDAGIALTARELERIRSLPLEAREALTQEIDNRDAKGWWTGWFVWVRPVFTWFGIYW